MNNSLINNNPDLPGCPVSPISLMAAKKNLRGCRLEVEIW